MRTKKIILLLSAITLVMGTGTQAQANKIEQLRLLPAAVCPSVDHLFERAQSCEENEIYAQAAKGCLASLDIVAAKTGLNMKSGFLLGKEKAQQKDFKETAEEYFKMTRQLDYMIELTELARVEVASYMEKMILPEDDGETFEEDMAVPCFGDNMNALEEIAKQMDNKQTEFEKALEVTKTQLMSSQGHKTNMGAINNSPMPVSTAPVDGSTGAAPKGKGWGKSDISGTEDVKKPK